LINTFNLSKEGVFVRVCGIYSNRSVKVDKVEKILSISTDKRVYHSNEIMKVYVEFFSSKNEEARITVSGITNAFGRAMINQTKDVEIKKGINKFDFVFHTPSCEECSALRPGVYVLNATVIADGRSFKAYTKVTLQGKEVDRNITSSEENLNNVSGNVIVEYFYDPNCLKCTKALPVIQEVVSSYESKIVFLRYNVLTDEGLKLARKYKLRGVPSVVINRKTIISYEDYNGNLTKLESLLREGIEGTYSNATNNNVVLSLPSVFVFGFLAGFNPCLLAILAFIASVTLATTGRRSNVLLIVMMFSLGIFFTYLIVGIGLLSIIQQFRADITNIVVFVIGFLGLWHVYDAYHLRKNKTSSFYTPKSFVRLTESITKKVSLPAAFFMGSLFSLIKAPCVGAVYLVILDMVRRGEVAGMLYLTAYNLGVVLPVLIIGSGIAFGLSPERVETFRKERREVMRLITGLTLLLIALLMYAGVM